MGDMRRHKLPVILVLAALAVAFAAPASASFAPLAPAAPVTASSLAASVQTPTPSLGARLSLARTPTGPRSYFGARYYGSRIGRFTSVDPVQTIKANLVDPQRWNRYAYVRNNPLRYNDPTGAVLELTGENRERAFGVLQQVAGAEGGKLLSTRSEGGRTFVGYSGKGRDSLAATGQVGVYLADIIDSEKTTEFSFATTFATKHGTQTTAFYGGAATVGMEESINGNTQVFLNPDAANIMYGISHSLLGRAKSSGGPLPYTDALIAGHELGHAWANLRGDPLYMSNASNATALRVENLMRARMGLTDTRVFH